MKILHLEQGSELWLQARAGLCTASRFADARAKISMLTEQQDAYVKAILAGHDESTSRSIAGYKSAPRAESIKKAILGEDVSKPASSSTDYAWSIALERIAGKPVDESFNTWQMKRGTELEPHARFAYEIETGYMASESGICVSDCGRYGYSSDGLVDDDGMIEIKCPAAPQKIGAIWSDPDHAVDEYIDQIQGGLWITGRKWCDFIMYCPWLESVGKDLFRKRIDRDEAFISSLANDLASFSALVDQYEAILRKPKAV